MSHDHEGDGTDSARRRTTVVVTRPRERADGLLRRLEAEGFGTLLLPSIERAPPADPAPFLEAVADLGGYDWLLFTSANGARAVAEALSAAGAGDGTLPPTAPLLAAVGPATAKAIRRELGRPADLLPASDYTAEGLLDAFLPGEALDGLDLLLPLAERARDVLPEGLAERGARVHVVEAYRTLPPAEGEVEAVREAVERGSADFLTFTSPSTAENFLDLVGDAALRVPAVAIGPVTAEAARALGYEIVGTADPHTVDGLVEAVRTARRGEGR